MSRFNKIQENPIKKAIQASRTTNHEGGEAYKLEDKQALYSLAATTTFNDKFYESGNSQLARTKELVRKAGPEFSMKLAVYCRETLQMRTSPLVLAIEALHLTSGSSYAGRAITRIIKRADELTEILAYYQQSNARTGTKKLNRLSNQLKKGLANAFKKFDEYQLAKYNRTHKDVKLKDVLFLSHAKPENAEQKALWDRLISDTMKMPNTWETKLSEAGKSEDKEIAKTAAWDELILQGKEGLNYMALMRNLRNMIQAGIKDESKRIVIDRLANEKEVLRSKQFPFRFLSAYKELEKLGSLDRFVDRVKDALETAIDIASDNIPLSFDSSTSVHVSVDVSASMTNKLNAESALRYVDVGYAMGMLLRNKLARTGNTVDFSVFGTYCKSLSLPTNVSTLKFISTAGDNHGCGHSTNGYEVVRSLRAANIKRDKIFIFSDMQLYGNESFRSQWEEYKRFFPKAQLYLFDLTGYGTVPVSVLKDDVYLMAGWSDKTFQMLSALERGGSIVEEIEAIQL